MSISGERAHEARFWKQHGDRLECQLCPHHCRIAEGKVGICGVRQNRGGRLCSLIYGKASSVHVDPMEKKPLFHFLPGESVLSLGSIGCNLGCAHCQNYTISQARFGSVYLNDLRPEDVVRLAKENHTRGVAFTYNEPTIWHEFAFDTFQLCREKGLRTIYVTNGFIELDPLRELAPFLSAMNIDVKGFREPFYREVCKARLAPVLAACELAHELGVHLELTYLIIPSRNDDQAEIRDFCRWAASKLGRKVPVHFSRFHPDFRMMDLPATPVSTMHMASRVGREEGLSFVYLGNVWADEEDTFCPRCRALNVRRNGYAVEKVAVKDGRCSACGEDLNMVM
ncbi:MAG: AmmeMemoRadiSam system radical SAM enzyme [Methanomassiliicoccales archaeon]|jgi:pyruvate formate lyase activating enzyme|nr:AmmeMemoRadiSam system radical SAM enzyme [Methanomassiliicoccales archaeon]